MFFHSSVTELNKIIKQRNIAITICLLLIIITLVQSIIILTTDHVVVMVPSTLNQETAISKNNVSAAYLESTTRDVVNVMLNITPDNTTYVNKTILKVTHPKFYGILKSELAKRSEDVINRRIAIHFDPASIVVNQGKLQAYVTGQLETYLGKEMVDNIPKTYVITYDWSGFKLLITDFHEELPLEKQSINNQ